MDDRDDPVGYGKPPKAGQFKKGKSGNPRGRPRKQPPPPEIPASRHPTREYIRREAERALVINDSSGRMEITARQAVLRAAFLKAVQGGVIAQRTVVQLMKLEDELYHQELRCVFDYWITHRAESSAKLAAAIKAGKSPPEILPHPDDVELDYLHLTVRMLGATNQEEREAEKRIEVIHAFSYEAWFFHEMGRPDGEPGEVPKGMHPYLVMYEWSRRMLPPRLRREAESFDKDLMASALQGRSAWRANLKRRCHDAEFPITEFPLDCVVSWEVLIRAGFVQSKPIFAPQPRGIRRPRGRHSREAGSKEKLIVENQARTAGE